MNSLKLKNGDTVMVIAGKDKGKKGKILKTIPSAAKVVVEGVNIVTCHNKPKSAQDQGGIVKKEAPIYACKVMVVCPKCHKPTRLKIDTVSGEKVRNCKQCGYTI